MNHHSPKIKLLHPAGALIAAAHGYLLLCVVLGAEVAAQAALVAPQSVAGRPQDPVVASATSSDRAAISGTVKEQSGTALPGVQVTLTNERTAAQSVVVTTEHGAYVFAPVDAGTYTLAAELSGFQNAIRSHLTVNGHERLKVDFSLLPNPSASSRQTEDAATPPKGKGVDPKQLVSGFDYDAKPNYKPGEVASSAEPAGYSSAAKGDSYDLILDYVQSEHLAEDRKQAEGAEKSKDHQAPNESKSQEQGRRSEIDEAAFEAWNENQFFSHGSDLLLHREFAPATKLFQRGVAYFPESAELQMGLGIALYADGLYDQAVSVLVRATDMVPSDPRPYLLLARAYYAARSENDEVMKRLACLVELDPKSAPARYYYALSLRRSSGGKPGLNAAQIERSLKSAVALDPQFADAHLELGALYAEQTKYADAIREYRQAIAIHPDLASAHYRLAQAYGRTGDKAAAQNELSLYEHLQQTKPIDSR